MAGNKRYASTGDLSDRIPVFPLSGALLLPSGQMPLNIFEPRYLAMVDAALAGDRIIGMIQPRGECSEPGAGEGGATPGLCDVGCLGRIVQFAEAGDGRYLITLAGISRFRVSEELTVMTPFRQCLIAAEDFPDLDDPRRGEEEVDRDGLLRTFRAYLAANELEADWESVERASNAGLVTALSMMSPWGASEKQALLEAADHAARARTLIAITEIALAQNESSSPSLQ